MSGLRLPDGPSVRSLSQRAATSLIAALRDTPSTTAWRPVWELPMGDLSVDQFA